MLFIWFVVAWFVVDLVVGLVSVRVVVVGFAFGSASSGLRVASKC